MISRVGTGGNLGMVKAMRLGAHARVESWMWSSQQQGLCLIWQWDDGGRERTTGRGVKEA